MGELTFHTKKTACYRLQQRTKVHVLTLCKESTQYGLQRTESDNFTEHCVIRLHMSLSYPPEPKESGLCHQTLSREGTGSGHETKPQTWREWLLCMWGNSSSRYLLSPSAATIVLLLASSLSLNAVEAMCPS